MAPHKEEYKVVDKAIKKLKEEISKNASDQYIKYVGEFLLDHIKEHPQDAEKIIVENKTIAKSLDEMASLARKKAENIKGTEMNKRVMFTPVEGLEIVLKYFDISRKLTLVEEVPKVNDVKTLEVSQIKQDEVDFDINLNDFLK